MKLLVTVRCDRADGRTGCRGAGRAARAEATLTLAADRTAVTGLSLPDGWTVDGDETLCPDHSPGA